MSPIDGSPCVNTMLLKTTVMIEFQVGLRCSGANVRGGHVFVTSVQASFRLLQRLNPRQHLECAHRRDCCDMGSDGGYVYVF